MAGGLVGVGAVCPATTSPVASCSPACTARGLLTAQSSRGLQSPRWFAEASSPAPRLQPQHSRSSTKLCVSRATSGVTISAATAQVSYAEADKEFIRSKVQHDLDLVRDATGVDLATAHAQVVATLNPKAAEAMQRELEQQVAGLQQELAQAHQEVHMSEERLLETLTDLGRLQAGLHSFTPTSVETTQRTASTSTATSMTVPSASISALPQHVVSASTAVAVPEPQQQQLQKQQQQQQQQPKQRRSQQQRSNLRRGLESTLEIPPGLKEHWFPVAFAGKLGPDTLVPLELFQEQWVLFRDEAGAAACVKDECAHRACPLSLGSVVDGQVQCPYHGWQYNAEGACTAMPSTAFCRGVAVTALPVLEADGFVWVWPGSSPPPPAPPASTQPPSGFTVHAELELEVPVEHGLLLENLLDLAHAPFTHTSTFAKGWPVPEAVRFHASRLLGGNWEPYPIDMSFEPPCMVLSTIGLAQPGKIERGARAAQCTNHLHQLHVCLPVSPGRTRLLYRMSMDFLGWTRYLPGIQRFWANIAEQVMGEDTKLVVGQQRRLAAGADVWGHPVAYDKLGVRYRRWRNSVASGDAGARVEAEAELSRVMTAGELFACEAEGCQADLD